MTEVTKRRKLNFEKCEYCRKDKKKVIYPFVPSTFHSAGTPKEQRQLTDIYPVQSYY